MELEKLLLSKHAKSTTSKVIEWVNYDPQKFKLLMQLVLGHDLILAQRAAWAMSYIVIEQPKLIDPYLNKLLELVQKPVHPAIKRNTFRFLKEIEIPKKSMTKAIDACFSMVVNPKEPIAVICFAFNTLSKMAKQFPEIKNEILFATELHQENESAGLKHTIKKVRKELMKINQPF
jgi:hypothetical protein